MSESLYWRQLCSLQVPEGNTPAVCGSIDDDTRCGYFPWEENVGGSFDNISLTEVDHLFIRMRLDTTRTNVHKDTNVKMFCVW